MLRDEKDRPAVAIRAHWPARVRVERNGDATRAGWGADLHPAAPMTAYRGIGLRLSQRGPSIGTYQFQTLSHSLTGLEARSISPCYDQDGVYQLTCYRTQMQWPFRRILVEVWAKRYWGMEVNMPGPWVLYSKYYSHSKGEVAITGFQPKTPKRCGTLGNPT